MGTTGCRRHQDRVLRADRTRGRFGRPGHPDEGHQGRQRLADQRAQALHHQRRARRLLRGLRGDRSGQASRRRHHGVPGSRRPVPPRPGPVQHLRHPPRGALLRGLLRARRPRDRRGRPRLLRGHGVPQRRPRVHRGAGAGARGILLGRRDRARASPHGFRQTPGRLPGRRLPARTQQGRHRGHALAGVPPCLGRR